MPNSAIIVRTPARSLYRQRPYQCASGTVTKSYEWDNVYEIQCSCCGEMASLILSDRVRFAQGAPPTEYAVDPKSGKLWVSGRAGRKPPKGYVMHEIKTWRDRDAFYRQMRTAADAGHEDFANRHEAEFGALVDDGHATLRNYLHQNAVPEIDSKTNQPTGRMVSLSTEGRDLIRMALERLGYERPKWSGADCSIAAWEEDNSSHRDEETGWRERRA